MGRWIRLIGEKRVKVGDECMMKPYICPQCGRKNEEIKERFYCPECNGTGVVWGHDLPYPLYPAEPWVLTEETKERWKRIDKS